MPMIISPDSALGKELAKFERPYRFEQYPRMMYRAIKVDGKNVCMMPAPSQFGWRDPAEYNMAIIQAEQITKSNQRVVQSEDEEHRARAEGWCITPDAALEHLEELDTEVANAAAETNFSARRMGDLAQREHAAATDSTHEHVVDVKPKRKYTRRAKVAPVAVTGSGEVEG